MKEMAFISKRNRPGIYKGECLTWTLQMCIDYVGKHQGEDLRIHYLQTRD